MYCDAGVKAAFRNRAGLQIFSKAKRSRTDSVLLKTHQAGDKTKRVPEAYNRFRYPAECPCGLPFFTQPTGWRTTPELPCASSVVLFFVVHFAVNEIKAGNSVGFKIENLEFRIIRTLVDRLDPGFSSRNSALSLASSTKVTGPSRFRTILLSGSHAQKDIRLLACICL